MVRIVLKISVLKLRYPKGMTGRLPLCPIMDLAELIPKQLRDIRMQLWNILERREAFTSRSAEVRKFSLSVIYVS